MRAGRLGLALGVSLSLLFAAGLLWLVGFVGASGADCPPGSDTQRATGLDTPRSLWPPGAECAGAGQGEPTVVELVPGLGWVIVGLSFAALAILATGLWLEIRALRSRAAAGSHPEPRHASIYPLAWPD